jgi:hypothetical protein
MAEYSLLLGVTIKDRPPGSARASNSWPNTGSQHSAELISESQGEKEMRMTIGVTAFLFVCVLSVCGELQALSLENVATVVQINSCQDCEGVEQQNLAFIFQEISTNNVLTYIPDLIKSNKAFMQKMANKDTDLVEQLMNINKSQEFLMWCFSVSEDGELQALSLENMATVVQVNSCQDCEGVEQQNLAFIFQEISTNNVFMHIANRMKSDKVFMKKITNIASIIQENSCIECASVDQQNLVTIFQEIDIDNLLVNYDVYQKYLDISRNEINNIINISQINECVICQNVDQLNSVFILQHIGSEDRFTPTSEFSAQDALFSDLVNIAMILYRSTSESDEHDGEGMYRKYERYFVPVRPGVHSPKQSTGTR